MRSKPTPPAWRLCVATAPTAPEPTLTAWRARPHVPPGTPLALLCPPRATARTAFPRPVSMSRPLLRENVVTSTTQTQAVRPHGLPSFAESSKSSKLCLHFHPNVSTSLRISHSKLVELLLINLCLIHLPSFGAMSEFREYGLQFLSYHYTLLTIQRH